METQTYANGMSREVPDRDEGDRGHELLPLLQRFGRVRQMANGERLARDIVAGRNLYLVESGALKLSLVSPAGEELIVGLFFDGDILSVQTLDSEAADRDVVTALERTRVRILPLAVINALLREEPQLQRQLFRLASERIAKLQQQMLVVARCNATERVAGFLIELAERRPMSDDGSLRLPLSLYGIGCYLGLSLETVCRALRHIQREGAIRKRGRLVRIVDQPLLVTLAGESRLELPHLDLFGTTDVIHHA
jgi:CRP/FNR family transcriptional regulator